MFRSQKSGKNNSYFPFLNLIFSMFFFQITVILSIYRGATVKSIGGLYFLLGISLVGFVVVELFMVSISILKPTSLGCSCGEYLETLTSHVLSPGLEMSVH